MRVINHLKNKHYTKFGDLIFIYKNVNKSFIKLVFTEDSKYLLDDEDQGDWNKVIGKASWHRFFPFIKSIYDKRTETFIVWKYKPSTDEFWVADYYRVGDEHMSTNITKVKTNELHIRKMNFFKGCIRVGGYFGGNDSDNNGIGGVAPKDLTYKMQFI